MFGDVGVGRSAVYMLKSVGESTPPYGTPCFRVPECRFVVVVALFNHFVSDCPIPDVDMTSYADDFTLLASAPSIVEAEASTNQL